MAGPTGCVVNGVDFAVVHDPRPAQIPTTATSAAKRFCIIGKSFTVNQPMLG